MEQPRVHTKMTDGIAVVTMDDGKANALSHTMIDELTGALDGAEKEAEALLVVGRPGRFCAGFDLKTMLSGADAARDLVSRGAELYLRLYEFPRPVLMACTGHAVAGGAVLLLTADVRLGVAGEFQLGLNELAIGMPLPVFVQELARDRMDPRQRTAATLGAQLFSPEGAVSVGYLDEVVEPAALAEVALDRAKQWGQLAAEPYGATKRRMRAATTQYVRETLAADMARMTPPRG